MKAGSGSADFQSAVSQNCILPSTGRFDTAGIVPSPADWKSAIRQIENLRYGCCLRRSTLARLARENLTPGTDGELAQDGQPAAARRGTRPLPSDARTAWATPPWTSQPKCASQHTTMFLQEEFCLASEKEAGPQLPEARPSSLRIRTEGAAPTAPPPGRTARPDSQPSGR